MSVPENTSAIPEHVVARRARSRAQIEDVLASFAESEKKIDKMYRFAQAINPQLMAKLEQEAAEKEAQASASSASSSSSATSSANSSPQL
ncbi:unnamed protein product [Sympodiomycopsis kandeliae]